jgi:hypothetical protein
MKTVISLAKNKILKAKQCMQISYTIILVKKLLFLTIFMNAISKPMVLNLAVSSMGYLYLQRFGQDGT